jgi:hypothetical protein
MCILYIYVVNKYFFRFGLFSTNKNLAALRETLGQLLYFSPFWYVWHQEKNLAALRETQGSLPAT